MLQYIPRFKGFDFFPHNLRLPFMRYKDIAIGLSVVAMAISLALFFTRGLNYGVDFLGGTMIEVESTTGPVELDALRSKLSGLGIGDVQIQNFGSDRNVLIRYQQQEGGEAQQQAALRKVTEAIGDGYVQRRVEQVGPAVSGELRTTAFWAVLASLVAIVAYVWLRFDWQFAVGAIVALSHDVLVTVGIFALFQLEFDLSTVAALLTILGYSVNDTVVVSDRIRENMRKFKKMELNELLDLSINETLSRTILTGVTAIAVLISLFIFGGEVIRNFNLAMLLGVIIGTYSSIFIAAPILGYFGVRRDSSGAVANKPAAATAPSETSKPAPKPAPAARKPATPPRTSRPTVRRG